MTTYECFECGKDVDMDKINKIKCPYCGSRILKKKKREDIKKVKAR